MARTSQWDDNVEMWKFVADMRTGGMRYSAIHGLLAGKEKKRFGLINVPSEEVIRYNLNKRRLLSSKPSDLPQDELEEHHKGLVYMGRVIRYQIGSPPDIQTVRENSIVFKGFASSDVDRPTARTEIEEEIREEWNDNVGSTVEPEMFSRYPYFHQHMNCTLIGRKVNNALNAVKRTATEYNSERLKFLGKVQAFIEDDSDDTGDRNSRVLSLFRSIERSNKRPAKNRASSSQPKSQRTGPATTIRAVREELKSTEAYSELTKKLRKLTIAQNDLKDALTPVELIRKMVRDSECDLCTSKSLDRPE